MPHNAFASIDELPQVAPVFPLPGVLLLPRARLPLNIFEPRYLDMVDTSLMTRGRLIVMAQPIDPDADLSDDADPPALFPVATAGRIVSFMETDDGRRLITLYGVARVNLVEEVTQSSTAYREFRMDATDFATDLQPDPTEADMNREALIHVVREFVRINNLSLDWDAIEKTPNEQLVNSLSMISPYGPREKQALLEAPDVVQRCDMLIALTEMWLASGGSSENDGGTGPLQ